MREDAACTARTHQPAACGFLPRSPSAQPSFAFARAPPLPQASQGSFQSDANGLNYHMSQGNLRRVPSGPLSLVCRGPGGPRPPAASLSSLLLCSLTRAGLLGTACGLPDGVLRGPQGHHLAPPSRPSRFAAPAVAAPCSALPTTCAAFPLLHCPAGRVLMQNSKLESIASAAVKAADKVGAALIICITHTGGRGAKRWKGGGEGCFWGLELRVDQGPGGKCGVGQGALPCACQAGQLGKGTHSCKPWLLF